MEVSDSVEIRNGYLFGDRGAGEGEVRTVLAKIMIRGRSRTGLRDR